MKKGEKRILIGIVAVIVMMSSLRYYQVATTDEDPGIPFYSTASVEESQEALLLIRREGCRDCHTLWTMRDVMQSVPAPALDGIGSLRSEEWLHKYLSVNTPQEILPSRLKAEFRMPSYAHLSADERKKLASYLSSLRVEDWYYEETKKRSYEKLTGKVYGQ